LAPPGHKPDPGGRGSKSGRQGAIWIGSSVAKNYPKRGLRVPLGWGLRRAGRAFLKVATARGGGIAGFPPFDALLEAIPSFLAASAASPCSTRRRIATICSGVCFFPLGMSGSPFCLPDSQPQWPSFRASRHHFRRLGEGRIYFTITASDRRLALAFVGGRTSSRSPFDRFAEHSSGHLRSLKVEQ
jgi:hypothetical protein